MYISLSCVLFWWVIHILVYIPLDYSGYPYHGAGRDTRRLPVPQHSVLVDPPRYSTTDNCFVEACAGEADRDTPLRLHYLHLEVEHTR